MVIRGSIRGNGQQLAHYLLSGEVNEKVQVLDVDGRSDATDRYLHQTMQGMSLTAELTKSQKGLYHAQINPAYSEDRKMSGEDWLKAADILAEELGLSDQRRVVVLHTKKNRTHAHVVWERYDHQTGKVVANKFSRLAQDRARKEMERVFDQKPTPHRNQHRPELKEALTNFWNETSTGAEFIQTVHENGYLIAEGVPRHPFMIVDETGRSFDLVRQLNGVRIKEVRQRLRNEKLIPEKEAIELMRQKQEGGSDVSQASQQRDQQTAKRTASAFLDNKQDAIQESIEIQNQKRIKALAENFIQSGQELTAAAAQTNHLEQKKKRAREYFLNIDELTGKTEETVTDEKKATVEADDTRENGELTTNAESNDSHHRMVEDSIDQEEGISQSGEKAEGERHQGTLHGFTHDTDGLVGHDDPAKEEAVHRQQRTARQFFDNEDMTAPNVTDDEKELQRLIEEQKAIRERSRQHSKKRTR